MAQQKRNTQSNKSAPTRKKNPPKAPEKVEKAEPVNKKTRIPVRFFTAFIAISLFVIFVVMLFNPNGALISLIHNVVLGLIGRVGYYVSIPVLLYLFLVHAFSAKRPVIMRSICMGCLIVCAGCFAHLILVPGGFAENVDLIDWLYNGGIQGTTGGLLCGLIAGGMWLLLNVVTYIVLAVAGVFLLMGSLQITIPSIVRAIENRPRAEWEDDEEFSERPEPASVVVNHLANKRIERIENRRTKEEQKNIDIPLEGEPKRREKVKMNPKTAQLIRQIDEIDTPVSAAETPVEAEPATFQPEPMFTTPIKPSKPVEPVAPVLEEIPMIDSNMPPLDLDEPLAQLPQKKAPKPTAEQVAKTAKEKVTSKDAEESAAQVAAEIEENEISAPKVVYRYPPIDLLQYSRGGRVDSTTEMRENTDRLNEALKSFGVSAHICNVTRGPSVTRYEVELDKGVKLSRITNVANDLALSLGVAGVRIATVVGKISVVGIEVPNRAVTTVSLREVIDSQEFDKAKSKASFAVGKDIGGNCIVGNIAKLPHMLIAGTTGSGKSVCMNSIIISLLYKATPDEVKLIMIDPKMVELGIYNGIPHLLIPVVTDPKKAAGSLQWAVTEMMRRYKAMSDVGVRDLETYNSVMESEEGQTMPQVVVIVDELADLMLVASKEVEESICRIAQMGRAAGIHLIIATQRPSSDVITGLMKANIPSRIAFSVASAMESRIILDTQGAEKLVGRGDMLFAPIGSGKPLRVQGCYVDESEVEAVANYVKENFSTEYDQSVMEEIERKAAQSGNAKAATASDPDPSADEMDGDEMLPAAVDVILETGQASVSMLQRRLKLGYARAARIVDEMEEKGIVGPFQGSKPRTILVTKEQWDAMKSGQSQQMSIEEMEEDTFVPEDF